MYYDQGMFEEVNYRTSGIPAEVPVGGVFINMVTKEGGNRVRGDFRAGYSSDSLQAENHQTDELQQYNFAGGNPITTLYDLNLTAGGPFAKKLLADAAAMVTAARKKAGNMVQGVGSRR